MATSIAEPIDPSTRRNDASSGPRTARPRLGLILEAAALLLIVRLALWTRPFSAVRGRLDAIRPRRGSARDGVGEIARAIRGSARRLPFAMTCLVEALAAEAMLRRRGYACILRLGVRSREGTGSVAFHAHAWLEYDRTVVIGDAPDLADYGVMVRASLAARDADQATAPSRRNSVM
jgi:hypothetical protein